jgi:hypothetical protein
VLEEGRLLTVERGTPQGAVISPLLANIYLHYVYDLWVQRWRRRCAQGHVIVVRYADDMVVGFQYLADAHRFLAELKQRLEAFALELHPDKTRIIEFGRFAHENRRVRGQGKPWGGAGAARDAVFDQNIAQVRRDPATGEVTRALVHRWSRPGRRRRWNPASADA